MPVSSVLTKTASTSEDDVERRFVAQPVEVRASSGDQKRIGGYGIVFSQRSRPLQNFIEIVEPGFIRHSQSTGFAGIVCRYNHSDMMLLGTVDSGTLRLRADATGLDYTVSLPECRGDVWEYVSRGDVRNSSFAFQCFDDDFTYDEGYPVRHLINGRIIDVAPVPVPAYPDATVGLRSFARHFGVPVEDVEEYAQRDQLVKFFPRTGSRRAVSGKKKTWQQRQVELMAMQADPVTGRAYGEPRRKSLQQQQQTELLGMVLDPTTGKPYSAPRNISGRQAQVELMGMQLDPLTDRPYNEPRRKTTRQKVVETYDLFEP